MGIKEAIEFLQRALGYSITGKTTEKCLFLAYGPKDTGKTTLLRAVTQLLGDYAGQIKVDSLMVERGRPMDNNAKDDLADLRGKRFEMTSETGEGQRLREDLVKLLSQGQGPYKAVRKYESHFEFPETWKIWLDCNHLPVIKGTDEAIWERLVVIPFRHVVPLQEQTRDLRQQLLAEAEGILAWLVEGLRAWMKDGLHPLPASLQRERDEWRQEADDLGQWIEECCVKHSSVKAKSSDLYESNKAWRANNGLYDDSTPIFARKMKARGFVKKEFGHDKAMHWLGIGLKTRENRGYTSKPDKF